MKRLLLLSGLLLAGCGYQASDPAAERQAEATRTAMNSADRQVGMPRIVNFAQRKLLKNAYEDMDQTTLTYVYAQAMTSGKLVCLGQALGYGVSLGTQFTAGSYPQFVRVPMGDGSRSQGDIHMIDQPEPNGLYQPTSGAATIVDLIDPSTGAAHTALVEPNVITVPFKLSASVVETPCPADVDPNKVTDVKETSVAAQAGK